MAKSFGLLARIDWNIKESNKLAVRYQYNHTGKDTWATGRSRYFFNNSGYRFLDKTNSVVAELNPLTGSLRSAPTLKAGPFGLYA